MKRIALLILASFSLLSGMEQKRDNQADASQFGQLPVEVQSHILSFVPGLDKFSSYTILQQVSSQWAAIVKDQAYVNCYAQRIALFNSLLAKKLLITAVDKNMLSLAKSLLAFEIFPENEYRFDQMALVKSLDLGYFEMAELLTDYAMRNKMQHSARPLFFMAQQGNYLGTKFLLDHGSAIDSQDSSSQGETALIKALSFNHSETARLLLEHGANVNLDGLQYPLHIAADKGNYELVELIINNGAEINATDIDDRTPLFYAERGQYTAIIDLLVKHGGINYDSGSESEYDSGTDSDSEIDPNNTL